MDFIRNILPSNFERYLRGIDFPIGKQELLRRLKENVAPGVVVDQVGKRLPEGHYRSPQNLIKRLRNQMNNGEFSEARLGRMRDVMAGHVGRGVVPGVVTLVSRRGEVQVDAIGTKAFGGSEPMRRETIFRIASVTKPIVAAPTMGLPERIEGERNWDYRYAWIRDAAFTLYALISIGLNEEAGSFMGWVRDRCEAGDGGHLQPLYGIDGREEWSSITSPATRILGPSG